MQVTKQWALFFMLAASLLQISQTQTSECTDPSPSLEERGRGRHELRADTIRGLAVVMSNYTFSCSGFLQQWSIQWDIDNAKRCEIIANFHVLRPTDTVGFCGLLSVGVHHVILTPRSNPHSHQMTYSFNVTKTLRVEPGDVVGLVVMFGDSRHCKLGGRLSIMEATSDQPDVVYLARPATPRDLTDNWNMTGFGCDDGSAPDDDDTKGPSSRTRSTPRSGTRRPGTPRPGTPRPGIPREEHTREEDRSKRMTKRNEFTVYHGIPLISTIVEPEVLALEPTEVTAAPSEGPEDEEMGSGELQERGATAADLGDIMIPTGLAVGLLLVAVVAVMVALVALCYHRARQTHTKDDNIGISQNKAYSLSSATSALPTTVPEEKLAGRKPPIKPRPRYAMDDNTAYGTTHEEWGILQQHSAPNYITPKEMGLSTKMVAGDHHLEKCEENVYIVDGKIYEIPSEM